MRFFQIPQRSKWAFWLLVSLAMVLIVGEYYRIGDFNIFLQASDVLAEGGNPYEVHYGGGFKYFYSPFFAVLIYPLTHLPTGLVSILWNLLGLLMLIRVFWIISNHYLKGIRFNRNLVLFLGILLAVFPLYYNFHVTQMSIFMLFGVFESVYQAERKKWPVWGSFILAATINVKLLPLVVIPYLLYRGKFRASLLVILFLGVLMALPALVLGWSLNWSLHADWLNQVNPSNAENLLDIEEPALHSISSLVSALFSDQISLNELKIPRHILVLDETTIYWISNLLRLLLIGGTLYVLRNLPFRTAKSQYSKVWELSYLCLVIPLLFPHQQVYAFALLLPASYYIVLYLHQAKPTLPKGRFGLLMALTILAGLIINIELYLGHFREYYWHYKVLTYGALLLLALLLVCHPKRLEQ